jgi:hypothetical protein
VTARSTSHALDGILTCFTAKVPYSVSASEISVALVWILLNIYNTELDTTRDGMQVGSSEATDVWEPLAKVGVKTTRDGGGAEDQLLQAWSGAVEDATSDGSKGAIKKRIGLIDDQMSDSRQDVRITLADAREQMWGRDEEIDA